MIALVLAGTLLGMTAAIAALAGGLSPWVAMAAYSGAGSCGVLFAALAVGVARSRHSPDSPQPPCPARART